MDVDGDFYTTAAQVIPLILVAVAFEGRAVWRPELWARCAVTKGEMSLIRGIHLLATTGFLVMGETAALWGLGNDAPVNFEPWYTAWLTAVGLGAGGVLLIAQVAAQVGLELVGWLTPRRTNSRLRSAARISLIWFVGLVTATMAWVSWSIATGLSN